MVSIHWLEKYKKILPTKRFSPELWKTVLMEIKPSNSASTPLSPVLLEGQPVNNLVHHKHLGIIFQSYLSWSAHLEKVISKAHNEQACWNWCLAHLLRCYRQTVPLLCSTSPRVCQSPLAQCNTSHYSPCDGAHPSQHSTHCPAGRLDDSERPAASTARLAFIALETNRRLQVLRCFTNVYTCSTHRSRHASRLTSRNCPVAAVANRLMSDFHPQGRVAIQNLSFFHCSLLWKSLPSSLQCIISTTLFQHNLELYWAQYKYNTSSDIPLPPLKFVFLLLSPHPDQLFLYLFVSHLILDLSLNHVPHTRLLYGDPLDQDLSPAWVSFK